jgi:hypothetical protein
MVVLGYSGMLSRGSSFWRALACTVKLTSSR